MSYIAQVIFVGAQWELQTVRRGTQTSEWDGDTLNADIVGAILIIFTRLAKIIPSTLLRTCTVWFCDWPELPTFVHEDFYLAVYLV